MNENEMYMKLSDKIDKLIDKLDTKFDVLDHKLQNHEVRIVVLEQKTPEESEKKTSLESLAAIINLRHSTRMRHEDIRKHI